MSIAATTSWDLCPTHRKLRDSTNLWEDYAQTSHLRRIRHDDAGLNSQGVERSSGLCLPRTQLTWHDFRPVTLWLLLGRR